MTKPVIDFEGLRSLSQEQLFNLGMRLWSEESGLMLIPFEWYSQIPAGYMLTCIDGRTEPFQPGVTDDDFRFGMLAFGIIPNDAKENQS